MLLFYHPGSLYLYTMISFVYNNAFNQGTLTEGESSVQLTCKHYLLYLLNKLT